MRLQNSKYYNISSILRAVIILTSLSLCSCKKFLDKKRNNTVVSPTTLKELQGVLDDGEVMNTRITPAYGQASSDDYFMLQETFDARTTNQQKTYLWQYFDYYYTGGNDWALSYNPIYNANYCLEMVEKIPVSANEALWKNVKGSALFYRAYYFLLLLWNHAKAYDEASADSDLGIVLRLGSDFNVPSKRANVRESYERVIKDAMESIPLLPDKPEHTFRPSKGAAYGLLARAYLSMRKYDSALKYSDLCLQINSNLIDFNNDQDFLGETASYPIKQFNKETIFYTEMNLSVNNGIIAMARAKVDTVLYNSYDASDIRKAAFFGATQGYHNFKGSYSQDGSYFSGIATDEMYLTRAECYARLNQKESALADLNHLLERRFRVGAFVPVTANDSEEALDIILQERRKELVFRGTRWIDIKRLNKEGVNITLKRLVNGQEYTLEPNANFYALPIPADIVDITGIPQNPL